MSKPRPTRYEIILEPMPHPDKVPPIIRLRHALKHLGRQQYLRCVSARELPPADAPDPTVTTINPEDPIP